MNRLQGSRAKTNNPEIVEYILDEQASRVAKQFMARNPQYLSDDTNLLRIVNALSEKLLGDYFEDVDEGITELVAAGFWTVANLEAAYRDLLSDGLLRVPANTVRQLNEFEKLEVIRLAQSGQVEAALQTYLSRALNDDNPSVAVATDPSLISVCDAAVLFVFINATADFSPTEQRLNFIKQYAAGRPLNLQLIGAAWQQCKAEEKSALRSEMLGLHSDVPATREAVVENLDEMSDDEINNLYRGTRKHIAKTSRGPGMLA